jgi:hypothetical protein
VRLFKTNRLFFWSITVALSGHLLAGGLLYGIGKLEKPEERDLHVKILAFKPAPPKKIPEPPKPKIPEILPDIPFGVTDGNRKVKEPPKGVRNATKAGAKGAGPSKSDPGRPMVSSIGDTGDVPVDVKDEGLFSSDFQDVINASDIRNLGTGGGGDGDGLGDPDGKGDGDMPAGFKDGKRGGRVYFVRLKYGNASAWGAHAEGTRRLMAFMNQYFPCETDSWPMTATEMRNRYMNKGAQPTFLYIYCDETFTLSIGEAEVLREYLKRGGFLFMDSRPEFAIRDLVSSELAKLLPGYRLGTLPGSHPINSFLFALSTPGVGENVIDRKNYGVAKDGRLVVFYTMGNFSHLYSEFASNSDDYIKAQYQMGANVMLYGIRKGNRADIVQRAGAKAEVTNQAIDRLLSMGGGGTKPAGGAAEQPRTRESLLIKNPPPANGEGGDGENTPPADDGPEDVKLNDDD